MTRTKVVVGSGGSQVIELSQAENDLVDAEQRAWADGAEARAAEATQRNRRNAYQAESDHLFFEEQRGEVAAGTWAAKVDEIKARFPK
jgi:hypothetical protein